jgi:hypothetical protein
MQYTFEPTAYDLAREKQNKQSVKRLATEFKQQYKKAISSGLAGRQTTGGQLVSFKKAERICREYGQIVPDDLKCLIVLYEAAGID